MLCSIHLSDGRHCMQFLGIFRRWSELIRHLFRQNWWRGIFEFSRQSTPTQKYHSNINRQSTANSGFAKAQCFNFQDIKSCLKVIFCIFLRWSELIRHLFRQNSWRGIFEFSRQSTPTQKYHSNINRQSTANSVFAKAQCCNFLDNEGLKVPCKGSSMFRFIYS